MMKRSTKWVITLVFILLIAYSGFVTYSWLDGEKEKKDMMSYAIAISDLPLRELDDMGSMLEYLIEHSTDEVLRERISEYRSHARALYYSSSILYTSTQDEKYRVFKDAMKNLENFFISVNNRPDIRKFIENNLDTLKQMENILDTIDRINDLTIPNAEELLELSGELEF